MDQDEEFERRQAAVTEVTARLRGRGIAVTGVERPEDLVDLLSAVERFEAAVEAHGGDLMVDDLKSSEPDDRHFVVPPARSRRSRAGLHRPHRRSDGEAAPPSAAARLRGNAIKVALRKATSSWSITRRPLTTSRR